MYSVLLAAALTTGGDVANCHHRGGGSGCYGWYNGGCYGSCYGCIGSHGSTFGCSGCWGGCYGGGCYGGCWGGCYGGGCWGSCFGCTGCFGCYGGASPYYGPSTIVPSESAPPALMPPAPKGDTLPQPKPTSSSGLIEPYRARLLVDLPADAKLYIDDQLMKTTSDHRTFNTPRLDARQTYFYELRAEVVRDGKPVSVTKRVTLRAGDVIRARFGDMEAAETVSTVNAR